MEAAEPVTPLPAAAPATTPTAAPAAPGAPPGVNGRSVAPDVGVGTIAAAARSRRKRAIDVAVVLAASPIVLPIGLVVAVLVRLTSRGGALFRQERVGLAGESFRMLKFRTMVVDAEERLHVDPSLWDLYVENDYKLPAHLDPRMTRLGRLLRRTSLDELPQLLNVLGGSMSLVGPGR